MDRLERVAVLKKALYTACERGWSVPPGFCQNDFFREVFMTNFPGSGRELMDLRFCTALWYREADRHLADLKECPDVAEYLVRIGF